MAEKSVFMVGKSLLSDRVYAGLVRRSVFIGKKHDVTQSFIKAMIDYLHADGDMEHTIIGGDGTYVITIRRVVPQ